MIEGRRHDIVVNFIAPMTRTAMAELVLDDQMKDRLVVERVVPFALAMWHEHLAYSGMIVQAGVWERSGHALAASRRGGLLGRRAFRGSVSGPLVACEGLRPWLRLF